jgi:hypothetical protein
VKWHNFKLVLVAQKYMQDTADKLPTACLINLTTDPQEQGAALTLGFRHLQSQRHCH